MYALTIFLSAFLLFQVEPLIAKFILPWFGGTPAVWTTCLLFFQLTLLAGYLYAHAMAARLSGRAQAWIHISLLAATLLLLPIIPSEVWKPGPADSPTWRILLLLSVTIGAPYLVLSATAPLLQHWFHRTHEGRSPFRYYALSNVGALLALATYPLFFEPWLRLSDQGRLWSWLYAGFAISCGVCAVQVLRHASSRGTAAADIDNAKALNAALSGEQKENVPRPPTADILLWLALSACGSVMLLATTNQLCQDVAAIPFLWVLPLGLYLVSFVICFDRERWYRQTLFIWLMIAGVMLIALTANYGSLPLPVPIAIYGLTLFACCMCCHGELVKRKPHPRHLTLFYLMIATGGAAGGLFVAIVAPVIFTTYLEYPAGIIACCLLMLQLRRREKAKQNGAVLVSRPARTALKWTALVVGILVARWALMTLASPAGQQVVVTNRNFYGTLRLTLDQPNDPRNARYTLSHGSTIHGFQFRDAKLRQEPTMYYVPESGAGLALRFHPNRAAQQPLRIGVIGLGAGTLAAFAQHGDKLSFYEINPAVIDIADRYFTYRKDAAARGAELDCRLGDARIEMERQLAAGKPQQFDVLALDAFSSDSIPAHLLTRECFATYWRHLKPDGILAVHISNRYLNLEPVVRKLAELFGKQCRTVSVLAVGGEEYSSSSRTGVWMLVTSNEAFLKSKEIAAAVSPSSANTRPDPLWTDDFYSLYGVLR
ncbi:MAG: fused MFS/spermidine synthase [Planctomycetia bacterium]|nr:fused MFS/spermidine synthase [Planctomycetia bacterium]